MLSTTGKVIIGKEAQVKGTVLCEMLIEGSFNGELTVSGTLNLKTGFNLEGKFHSKTNCRVGGNF